MRASFLSPWCLLCEHCESGIKYLPHWVLLKKVNDFGQLYYLPQTLHCPIAVLSETCALASRPELQDPMELMMRLRFATWVSYCDYCTIIVVFRGLTRKCAQRGLVTLR